MNRKLNALCIATGLVASSVALADPVNAPNVALLDLQCADGSTVTVAAMQNGNQGAGPGHDVNGTGVLVPTLTTYSVIAPGVEFSIENPVGNGARVGQLDRLVTCSISFPVGDNGEGTATLSATVLITPARP